MSNRCHNSRDAYYAREIRPYDNVTDDTDVIQSSNQARDQYWRKVSPKRISIFFLDVVMISVSGLDDPESCTRQ